jgi:hypothetical protein
MLHNKDKRTNKSVRGLRKKKLNAFKKQLRVVIELTGIAT